MYAGPGMPPTASAVKACGAPRVVPLLKTITACDYILIFGSVSRLQIYFAAVSVRLRLKTGPDSVAEVLIAMDLLSNFLQLLMLSSQAILGQPPYMNARSHHCKSVRESEYAVRSACLCDARNVVSSSGSRLAAGSI